MNEGKCPDCIERGDVDDIRDIEIGDYCRRDYNRRWRAEQTGRPVPEVLKPGEAIRGPRPDPERSALVPCRRKGCPERVRIRGGRFRAYREDGTLPWHSRECQKTDTATWVEGLCACECGETWRKYRAEVEKAKTGRIFVNAEHANRGGRGTKPRTGREVPCEGCGEPMYVIPAEEGKKRFHGRECQRIFEAARKIGKTCPTCGTDFEVNPSQADKVYDTMRCKRLASMTNAIPGTLHNGLPKRWDSQGYVLVFEPDHPASGKYGWIFEHRLVVEKREGRYLTPREEVDHLDEVKDNNHPDNLEIKTKAAHSRRTSGDIWARRRAADAELVQYRRRFGALNPETGEILAAAHLPQEVVG